MSLSRSPPGSSRSSANAFVTPRYASRSSTSRHHRSVTGDDGHRRRRRTGSRSKLSAEVPSHQHGRINRQAHRSRSSCGCGFERDISRSFPRREVSTRSGAVHSAQCASVGRSSSLEGSQPGQVGELLVRAGASLIIPGWIATSPPAVDSSAPPPTRSAAKRSGSKTGRSLIHPALRRGSPPAPNAVRYRWVLVWQSAMVRGSRASAAPADAKVFALAHRAGERHHQVVSVAARVDRAADLGHPWTATLPPAPVLVVETSGAGKMITAAVSRSCSACRTSRSTRCSKTHHT
jgi:hypothetical protein